MVEAEDEETGYYRWNDPEVNEYYSRITPVIDRLQTLLQQYQIASQYEDSLKQYGEALERRKEVEENNKKLRYMLELCHRVRTHKDYPPIDLGNGKFLVTIAEDPTVW